MRKKCLNFEMPVRTDSRQVDKSDSLGGDLSGILQIRGSSSGLAKAKSGKKSYWFYLDKDYNQLQYYKSAKDFTVKDPLETLDLHNAGISYGNTDENEFIISIRGLEYQLLAESHKTMKRWMTILQKQVKLKPSLVREVAKATKLQSVPEESPLEIKRADSVSKKKKKKGGFFYRLFAFRKMKQYKEDAGDGLVEINRNVQAAPMRSVVGSMQDISTRRDSAPCKSCSSLEHRNEYLEEQVAQLTEDIENIKELQRNAMSDYTGVLHVTEHTHNSHWDVGVKVNDVYSLKYEYASFLQKSIVNSEESSEKLKNIIGFEQLRNLTGREEGLADLLREGTTADFTDHHGFIHGSRESPSQYLINLCEYVKIRYVRKLKESDEMYQKWLSHAAGLSKDMDVLSDSTVKILVQYGIPEHLRSKVWKILILNRVKEKRESKGDDYYSKLTEKLQHITGYESEDDIAIEKQIKIDLLRTMPTHSDFLELDKGKIPALHRILRAYLTHNPDVSYCQGMNFMVGFSLLYLDEETSFWLLVAITEEFFNKSHYNGYLSGTQANQKVLEKICNDEMPDLMSHLDDLNCQLSPVTFNWFMTIFIDSLPIEVVLHIWDCFLFHGHQLLYRIAFTVLKLHREEILKCKDSLSVMRKLKKMGRSFFDVEALLGEVFSEEWKYTDQQLITLYHKYLVDIDEENNKRKKEDEEYEREKQKLKFTPKAMMVSVSDSLDQLEDDLIIKCAECEVNRNSVWLLCSSDLQGQLFILNVASRNTNPVNWQVDCKCLDMKRLPTANVMLVSTIKSMLYAIDIESKSELWSISLAGSALSIACDNDGNVCLSLMDGSVAFLTIKSKDLQQTYPTYLDISRSPVMCGCLISEYYWCGAANKIIIVDSRTLETRTSVSVCPKERHAVTQLELSDYGVWSSVQNSAVLHLWHQTKFTCLLTIDVLDASGLISEKKTKSLSGTTITTIMALKDKLWIGFANGRFIICNTIIKENNDDDLNDAINLYKSTENLSTAKLDNDSLMKKSPSKLSVTVCSHQIVGEENEESINQDNNNLSVDGPFAKIQKRTSGVDILEDYEVQLKMNQIQRVSEQRVDCFQPCRNDGKLILSCMGAINDDSSVILWSSEKRDGREMWFAQTVSYTE